MLSIAWHGESFVLDGRGAVGWPARRTAILTDPHIGKDAHFRRSAIPVPFGSTLADLERVRALLSDHGADHLLILGDFFHAAEGARAPETLAALRDWRKQIAGVRISLVRGNHDLHAGDPPADLNIECLDELHDPPFRFAHHPPESNGDLASAKKPGPPCMAGHVHPAISLHDPTASVRARCFLFREGLALLPAFGGFTGSATIRPRRGDRVFAVDGASVAEVAFSGAS